MRIIDLLDADLVVPDMQATEKKAALAELCEPLAAKHASLDKEAMVRVLLDRERLGSTGIGEGVAIPHGKLPGATELLASFGRSKRGIDFDALDNKPAHLFFVLFAPEDAAALHLKALARISRLLKSPAFREALMEAPDAQAILHAIAAEEDKI